MPSHIWKFSAPKQYDQRIIRLVNDISEMTGVSKEIIKKHSENAIHTWELVTDQKINSLFIEKREIISQTIPRMLYYFESEFTSIIRDRKVMKKTLEITKVNLENIFS